MSTAKLAAPVKGAGASHRARAIRPPVILLVTILDPFCRQAGIVAQTVNVSVGGLCIELDLAETVARFGTMRVDRPLRVVIDLGARVLAVDTTVAWGAAASDRLRLGLKANGRIF